MVYLNDIRDDAGTVLIMLRAFTCRNSRPRYSPRPMWRSGQGPWKRVPQALSSSIGHRKPSLLSLATACIVHTFERFCRGLMGAQAGSDPSRVRPEPGPTPSCVG